MARQKRKDSYDTGRSFFGFLFKWTLVLGLWACIVVGGIFGWYAAELPAITRNVSFEKKASITVKARDGTVIGRYGDIKGRNIAAADLPPNLVYAVLAVEDRRFYSHYGIDFMGVARAVVTNAARGRLVQGGSTITQQLAKNLFLSQERTLKRKIQEAMLAVWLENELTKDEILSAYLNRVYMGSGAYGVDAAAHMYFHKEVKNLTIRESATLAGLLKAPSRFSPLSNPEQSRRRTDQVLKIMADAGYITSEDAKTLASTAPIEPRPPGGDSAKYYADWVVDSLQDLIGTPDEDIVVETTMDPALQKAAQESLVKAITENGAEKKISQGSVISMRPDGEVLAMVGGFDYNTNQFNRAVQAKRQPGSSFKPVVYLAALEHGWGPNDIILDAPFDDGKYRPQNYGGEYYGEVSMETALMLSLNTVSVRLIKAIGPAAVVNTAQRLGFTTKLGEDLSLALGSNAVSPLEITAAYGVLANGGIAIHPYAITRITSEKGRLYYQRRPPGDSMRVVAPDKIETLTMMMQNVIDYGTGQRAKLPWPAYGKTGTSQESRDAWFIGFTPEMVTSVWMGNDDNSPMKRVTGGSFPAGVWRDVMMAGHGRYAPVRYNQPVSIGFENLMQRLIAPAPAPEALPEQQPQRAPGTWVPRKAYRPQASRPIPESSRYND